MKAFTVSLVSILVISFLYAASASAELKEAKLTIEGMMCSACESEIGGKIEALPGVDTYKADWHKGFAWVTFKGKETPTFSDIAKAVKSAGKFSLAGAELKGVFTVSEKDGKKWFTLVGTKEALLGKPRDEKSGFKTLKAGKTYLIEGMYVKESDKKKKSESTYLCVCKVVSEAK